MGGIIRDAYARSAARASVLKRGTGWPSISPPALPPLLPRLDEGMTVDWRKLESWKQYVMPLPFSFSCMAW